MRLPQFGSFGYVYLADVMKYRRSSYFEPLSPTGPGWTSLSRRSDGSRSHTISRRATHGEEAPVTVAM